jgi:hypothetical protein
MVLANILPLRLLYPWILAFVGKMNLAVLETQNASRDFGRRYWQSYKGFRLT